MLCLLFSLSQKKLTNFINKIFLIPKPRHIYLRPIKEKFISVNIFFLLRLENSQLLAV